MKLFQRRKNWLPVIVVAFATMALVLYDFTPDTLESLEPTKPEAAVVQFFITDLHASQFNARGQLHYELNADRADHWRSNPEAVSAEDYTVTTNPHFIFHRADDIPWHLRAQQGTSTADNNHITLTEDVRAWQTGTDEQPLAEILTDSLTLQPQQQFAHTDKPVIIRYPRARYTAVGMEADFLEQTFTLLADVKGSHEPPNRQ